MLSSLEFSQHITDGRFSPQVSTVSSQKCLAPTTPSRSAIATTGGALILLIILSVAIG